MLSDCSDAPTVFSLLRFTFIGFELNSATTESESGAGKTLSFIDTRENRYICTSHSTKFDVSRDVYSEKLLIALLSLLDVFDGGNLAKDQFINLCSNNAVRITIYSNTLCCRRFRGIRCTSVLSFSPVSKLLDDTYLNK